MSGREKGDIKQLSLVLYTVLWLLTELALLESCYERPSKEILKALSLEIVV
jgi:hypothetical protein